MNFNLLFPDSSFVRYENIYCTFYLVYLLHKVVETLKFLLLLLSYFYYIILFIYISAILFLLFNISIFISPI